MVMATPGMKRMGNGAPTRGAWARRGDSHSLVCCARGAIRSVRTDTGPAAAQPPYLPGAWQETGAGEDTGPAAAQPPCLPGAWQETGAGEDTGPAAAQPPYLPGAWRETRAGKDTGPVAAQPPCRSGAWRETRAGKDSGAAVARPPYLPGAGIQAWRSRRCCGTATACTSRESAAAHVESTASGFPIRVAEERAVAVIRPMTEPGGQIGSDCRTFAGYFGSVATALEHCRSGDREVG
jgi:hypothetical protein